MQDSIKSVQSAADKMKSIGHTLSFNMNDTAKAATEIAANIVDVNEQVQKQEQNMKTANSAVESIQGNVKELISDIDLQSSSVVKSSTAIEEMVANIRSVTNILEKNSATIASRQSASEIGKEGVSRSVSTTSRIQDINNSISTVNELTKENRNDIEDVASAVDKFKV